MKFTIIKPCLGRFSGIFAVGTPSNIHGTAISYRCAKFGAFVNSVTILTLRDLTKKKTEKITLIQSEPITGWYRLISKMSSTVAFGEISDMVME